MPEERNIKMIFILTLGIMGGLAILYLIWFYIDLSLNMAYMRTRAYKEMLKILEENNNDVN